MAVFVQVGLGLFLVPLFFGALLALREFPFVNVIQEVVNVGS